MLDGSAVLADEMVELGESPIVWRDLTFVDSWTWSELQAAPDWVVERAILWANVLGAWRKAKADREAGA